MAYQNRPDVTLSGRIYSYGSNSLSSREVFRQRSVYNRLIFPNSEYPSLFDTWGKDRFYGIVNHKGNSVVVDKNQLRPLSFPEEESQFALNFVADAWRDFALRLRELRDQNIIFKNSPWSEPYVHKAWNSANVKYENYMNDVVYPSFNEIYMNYGNRDAQISGIETFLSQFEDFYTLVARKAGPFTKSGFIEGSYTSPLISGLMIEISEAEYDIDFPKGYVFKDANYELVSNIAKQYGFSFDKNIPWRLVADLRNPAMREYMYGVPIEDFEVVAPLPDDCDPKFLEPDAIPRAFGYSQIPGQEDVVRRVNVYQENGTLMPGYKQYQKLRGLTSQPDIFEIFFSTAYTETWSTDMKNVRDHLISFYNVYVETIPQVMVRENNFLYNDCLPQTRTINRSSISQAGFENVFGDRWKLKTFHFLRSMERQREKSKPEATREVQEVLNIYNLSQDDAYTRALRYCQEEFIGPYDRNPVFLDRVGYVIAGSPT